MPFRQFKIGHQKEHIHVSLVINSRKTVIRHAGMVTQFT